MASAREMVGFARHLYWIWVLEEIVGIYIGFEISFFTNRVYIMDLRYTILSIKSIYGALWSGTLASKNLNWWPAASSGGGGEEVVLSAVFSNLLLMSESGVRLHFWTQLGQCFDWEFKTRISAVLNWKCWYILKSLYSICLIFINYMQISHENILITK